MPATFITTKRGLKLTVKQAEYIYSTLDLHENKESLAEQRYIRLQVSQIYETGTEDINKDRWKAKKYLAEATNATQVTRGFFSRETVFTVLELYTQIRLQIARLDRLFNLPFIGKAFLDRLFAIAGFSYFVSLSYDLYLTTRAALISMNPETPAEKRASFFARVVNRFKEFGLRFKNALEEEEGRKNRMLNAAFWGPVNLVLFLFTFGWSALLSVGGFVIDVFNAYYRRSNIVDMHQDLLNQLNNKIMESENEEQNFRFSLKKLHSEQSQIQDQLASINSEATLYVLQNRLLNIKEEIETLEKALVSTKKDQGRFKYEFAQVTIKTQQAKRERNIALATVSLVLLGVILYTIPVLFAFAIPGVNIALATAGACIVLSVTIYCLSKKLWEIGKNIAGFCKNKYDYYKGKNAASEKAKHINNPIPTLQVSSTEKIKKDIRNNIKFLKKCQEKIPPSDSMAETFDKFTEEEIITLRRIFNLENDEDWKKQLKYLIKYAQDENKLDSTLAGNEKGFLKNRIEFLKECQYIIETSKTLTEIFKRLTQEDELQLRIIFHLKNNQDFKTQFLSLINQSPIILMTNDGQTFAEVKKQLVNLIANTSVQAKARHDKIISAPEIQRCSFKMFLENRIHEEREFGFILDSDTSSLARRLTELKEEPEDAADNEIQPDVLSSKPSNDTQIVSQDIQVVTEQSRTASLKT